MGTAKTIAKTTASAVTLGAAVVVAIFVLPECSSPSGSASVVAAGSSDSVADSAPDSVAEAGDEPFSCGDSGVLSDWPGWRRLREFCATCKADVPVDPSQVIPKIEWVPCANQPAGCQEMKNTWHDGGKENFFSPVVSHDSSGAAKMMRVGLLFDRVTALEALWNFSDGRTLTAVLADPTDGKCSVDLWPGPSTLTVVAFREGDTTYLKNGDPAHLFDDAGYRPVATKPIILPWTGVRVSDTTVAFGLALAGAIVRVDIATNAFVVARKPALPMILDLVEKDDIFCWSEYGTTSYGEEYIADKAGNLILLRSRANAHVSAFATDGVSLFWTESYGAANPQAPVSTIDVWSAPYTTDPGTLAASARKLATFAATLPAPPSPGDAVAFRGVYAFGVLTAAYVVRLSDGKLKRVDPTSPGWVFRELAYVDEVDLWLLTGPGNFRQAFQRIALGAW